MPEQLFFELPSHEALGPEDFFVSDANRDAVAMVTNPDAWPEKKLVLVGPPRSGKSHLARIFENQTSALRLSAYDLPVGLTPEQPVVVEDMDRLHRAAEETMFHLHNALRSAQQPLLMTARSAPGRWSIALPDLASRMQATTPIHIQDPDDDLLGVLITKLFADRQVVPSPNVVRYVVSRMDRSFKAAAEIVDALDRAALRNKTAVTIKLAGTVLDQRSALE